MCGASSPSSPSIHIISIMNKNTVRYGETIVVMADVQSSHRSTPMHASVYTPQDEPQQVNECTADCGCTTFYFK